jgi:hypothetical protein
MVKVIIKKSTNPKKKYMAIFYEGDKKIKTTHFGFVSKSDPNNDFTKHGDESRKQRYLDRHRARENWNDYKTAGALSRWILWNKKTFTDSVADYKRRFKLK